MKNFKELIRFARKKGKKTCVVVKAEDQTLLEGIRRAQDLKIVSPILVGNKNRIKACARPVGLAIASLEIHDIEDEKEALKTGMAILKKRGDLLMKGMLSTSSFLKGVLDREWGLRGKTILSHIAVLEIPAYHKLIFMSDGGMNPKLDLKTRIEIITNAISLMKVLGIKRPKIALMAASEAVHPDMPETTDARTIVELAKKGEIKDAIIEGPFGFDVAVSKAAAKHKKIKSEIAGDVDFLLMPGISAGNIWAKGLIYFARAKAAGIVAGAQKPVLMLSRADDAETKLNSIALGVAVS